MLSVRWFEEENSFQENDVDVAELVTMLSIIRCSFLREIHLEVDAAAVSQGENQSREHLLETERMLVKMLSRILPIEPNVRQI